MPRANAATRATAQESRGNNNTQPYMPSTPAPYLLHHNLGTSTHGLQADCSNADSESPLPAACRQIAANQFRRSPCTWQGKQHIHCTGPRFHTRGAREIFFPMSGRGSGGGAALPQSRPTRAAAERAKKELPNAVKRMEAADRKEKRAQTKNKTKNLATSKKKKSNPWRLAIEHSLAAVSA